MQTTKKVLIVAGVAELRVLAKSLGVWKANLSGCLLGVGRNEQLLYISRREMYLPT
jgi:hypothetical protein